MSRFQSVSIIKSILHHFQSETQTQLVLSDSSHFTSLTAYSLQGKKKKKKSPLNLVAALPETNAPKSFFFPLGTMLTWLHTDSSSNISLMDTNTIKSNTTPA